MTKILGNSVATAKQMSEYLLAINPSPKFSRTITALDFCQLFLDVCAKEGVRGDIAFAQSCKETGNFKFNGDVKYTQNNFAGLGATGGGVSGCVFSTIEEGILAQAQHLKTYATKENLNEPCVDPRRTNWFVKAKGGTSPDVETLGGTWAVPGYSTSKYSSLEVANKAKDSYGYQIVNILNNILKVEDKKEDNAMGYTNSPLVTYAKISPNKTSPRNHKIDTITIHCFVGQVTAESGCNAKGFVTKNLVSGSSCNYVVGYDGSIGLCVDEKDRSFCTSNKKNDHRAITIECASKTQPPYAVTDKAMKALINLCADICKRNNIKKLVWSTVKNERVNHLNGCNMTVHRDFAAKSCPGEYLYNKHGYIADEVNKILGSYVAHPIQPLKLESDKKAIQTYLNTYYSNEIKGCLGELLVIDGSIGAKSRKALTVAVQTELNKYGAGLEVDGSFGSRTLNAYKKYAKTLKKGDKGDVFITLWQCTLVGLNYNPNGIDGSFGNGCKSATTEFQKNNKLTVTGALNGDTFKKALK